MREQGDRRRQQQFQTISRTHRISFPDKNTRIVPSQQATQTGELNAIRKRPLSERTPTTSSSKQRILTPSQPITNRNRHDGDNGGPKQTNKHGQQLMNRLNVPAYRRQLSKARKNAMELKRIREALKHHMKVPKSLPLNSLKRKSHSRKHTRPVDPEKRRLRKLMRLKTILKYQSAKLPVANSPPPPPPAAPANARPIARPHLPQQHQNTHRQIRPQNPAKMNPQQQKRVNFGAKKQVNFGVKAPARQFQARTVQPVVTTQVQSAAKTQKPSFASQRLIPQQHSQLQNLHIPTAKPILSNQFRPLPLLPRDPETEAYLREIEDYDFAIETQKQMQRQLRRKATRSEGTRDAFDDTDIQYENIRTPKGEVVVAS
ncbi:unnamed protein product [Anisakis simplex]|uniref:Uncharacterized protein n=1 Tax=Anisakis simplex TaxID=6269 RepID=A0A0M3KDY4_ANISI|nr:unnamed protein product [Anisakis simplex]